MSGAGDIKLTKDGNVLLHEMVRKSLNVKSFHTLFHTTLILKNQTVSCLFNGWFLDGVIGMVYLQIYIFL